MSVAAQVATGAGTGAGLGVAIWAAFRFVRWATEFIAGRVDRRAERIDLRERDLEQRFNRRLRHVEQELDRYRQATMRLVNALALRDPKNPVLAEVAMILRTSIPIEDELPTDFDDLARKAEGALRDAAD